MYPKRFHPLDDPPTASSSDEEEEFEGNSSSDVEDESSKKPSMKKPQSPLQVSDSESDPEEEECDSDSETERKEPVPNPQSPVVKSVTETKKQDSKKDESPAKSATKRSSVTDRGEASRDVKRVKKVSEEETKKNNPFRRIWSEDDEIMALQGLIDYHTKTGSSPFDDMGEFYQLVKKSLGFDASKTQLTEKLRSVKKKYQNNLGKAKKGEEPTFSNAHDRKVFELSKVIWGANGIALESTVKPSDKSEKKKRGESVNVKQKLVSSPLNGKSFEDEVMTNNKEEASSLGITESDTFVKSFLVSLARNGMDDLSAQLGWSRLTSDDKKRFEEQWKTLKRREFEFYNQKTGFFHEVVSKMTESFRSIP